MNTKNQSELPDHGSVDLNQMKKWGGLDMRGIITSVIMMGFLMGSASAEAAERKWVIAVQPTATPEALSDKAAELETFLEKRLGGDVKILFPTQYAGVIEALKYGHADAAFMSAWPARLAIHRAGARVILAEVREVIIDDKMTEAPYYHSYWIVRKDSPYQTLADLRGKKCAFAGPLSTSGYVAPLARLVEDGLVVRKDAEPADPSDFCSEVIFAGGYAQAAEALKSGQVDVTVIAGDVPEKLFRETLDASRVVASQGPIPSHSVVAARKLSAKDRKKLVAALLELGQPEHRPLMRKFISGIFVRFERAGAAHLESLKQMLERTGLEFTEKK
jgi:phosphonate transport system substrate-binding protein